MSLQLPVCCLASAVLQEQLLLRDWLAFKKKRKALNYAKQKIIERFMLEETLKIFEFQLHAMVATHQLSLPRAPSSLDLNYSKETVSTTFQSSLLQQFTTLSIKNFSGHLISKSPSFSLKPFHFVISLSTCVKIVIRIQRRCI